MKNVMLKGDLKEELRYLNNYFKIKSLEWKQKLILIDYELTVKGFGVDCYYVKVYSSKKKERNSNIYTTYIPIWYLQEIMKDKSNI